MYVSWKNNLKKWLTWISPQTPQLTHNLISSPLAIIYSYTWGILCPHLIHFHPIIQTVINVAYVPAIPHCSHNWLFLIHFSKWTSIASSNMSENSDFSLYASASNRHQMFSPMMLNFQHVPKHTWSPQTYPWGIRTSASCPLLNNKIISFSRNTIFPSFLTPFRLLLTGLVFYQAKIKFLSMTHFYIFPCYLLCHFTQRTCLHSGNSPWRKAPMHVNTQFLSKLSKKNTHIVTGTLSAPGRTLTCSLLLPTRHAFHLQTSGEDLWRLN